MSTLKVVIPKSHFEVLLIYLRERGDVSALKNVFSKRRFNVSKRLKVVFLNVFRCVSPMGLQSAVFQEEPKLMGTVTS